MSLRTKFSLAAAGLVVVVVAVVSAIMFFSEKRYLLEEQRATLLSQIRGLAEVARESQVTRNDITLLHYLRVVRVMPGVLYAMVVDGQGEVLAHTDPQQLGVRLADEATRRALAAGGAESWDSGRAARGPVLEWAAPLVVGGRRAGAVRIGYSRSVLDARIAGALATTGRRLLGVSGIMLALGILSAMGFAEFMTRPIRRLSQGARIIGLGRLEHRISDEGRDELGALAREFNAMAAQLQELDQMKEDFVASVSHELRNPLTAIRGHVDLLAAERAGPLTEQQRGYLEIIGRNIARLSRFITSILDLAKLEAGQEGLNCASVEVEPLLQDIVALFRPIVEEKNVRMEMVESNGAPKVWADREKVGQVVTNLVSNAFKFTPAGGRIRVGAAPDGNAGVEISVSDTGVGIPPESIGKIFSKFYQVKRGQNGALGSKGTGLGLALAKEIVELHGAELWVESQVNVGSTFHFSLPAAKEG